MNCRVCNTEIFLNVVISVPEKMFGTNENFDYCICPKCKCLQIINIPDNIDKYYPSNYYSFTQLEKQSIKKKMRQFSRK